MDISSGITNLGMMAVALQQQTAATQVLMKTLEETSGMPPVQTGGNQEALRAMIACETGRGTQVDEYA